jgi:hypothetical protein
MNPIESSPTASPRAQALGVLIESTVEQVRQRQSDEGAGEHHALLFTGNYHTVVPWVLISDPVLDPTAKVIWQVVSHYARPGSGTAFPSYRQIRVHANVGGDATVARAIALLRITRWLSLCARVRGEGGRFAGSVYALHDEPVSATDAGYLDPTYRDFLNESLAHRDGRVARVARVVLSSMEAGHDVTETPSIEAVMERRLTALDACDGGVDSGRGGSYAVGPDGLQNLKAGEGQGAHRLQILKAAEASEPRLQNLKPAAPSPPSDSEDGQEALEKQSVSHRLQILKTAPAPRSSCCSSSNKNKTTTTTGTTFEAGEADRAAPAPPRGSLDWPAEVEDHERELVTKVLARAEPVSQQDVLDQWAGDLHEARAGRRKAIARPYAYLASLCRATRDGRFVMTDTGLAVRRRRQAGAEHVFSRVPATPTPPPCEREPQGVPDDTSAGGAPTSLGTLAWPTRLTGDTRREAEHVLGAVPDGRRQDVLDQWEGHMWDDHQGAVPVADPMRLFERLCRLAEAGALQLQTSGRMVRYLRSGDSA